MRIRFLCSVVALFATVAISSLLDAQSPQSTLSVQKPSATANLPFDPHDLSGNWIGDPQNPKAGRRNWAGYDQKVPEPPLTDWAKQHLLMKSISHDPIPGGKNLPGWDRAGHLCPNNQDPCYATDPNGVRANDPEGEYPGKDCEPLTAPAMYDYPSLGMLTFFVTPERIVQLNNYHREWRIFWLNQEHPKEMDPTFEGDSTAKWDGNSLVVDTIGFNGRTQITQSLGQWKSDAFHLVERWTRVDHDHLILDMTYYDPKAWGDKSWSGFRRYYHLVPIQEVHDKTYQFDQYTEWICSPEDNKNFDKRVTDYYKK